MGLKDEELLGLIEKNQELIKGTIKNVSSLVEVCKVLVTHILELEK